ncbi:glycoside hydrolase family 5 protein [uncultured Enterovirga sp.]|uniref:glycoside hydrolase family 5 protein n=1 Tax=uncultured Enterovirga sp. TaxID=2026352 RepID=UPI0035CAD801
MQTRPAAPARLARGLNLSHWFAQSVRGYGPDHLAGFVTDRDLDRLVEAGFTHVRLGLEPSVLFDQTGGEPRLVAAVLEALEAALDRIGTRGLATVLDLHPVGSSKEPLLTPAGAGALVDRWAVLARHLASHRGGDLFLEILNEPEPMRGDAWWALQDQALRSIRDAGATGPVIVNGGGWSGVDDLVGRRGYADRNVIYTAHCYAPLLFTHQAADWTWDVAKAIGNLPWPIAPSDAHREATVAATDERARGFLRAEIEGGRFTREALVADLDRLAAWARAEGGAAIYIGEFGVYAKAAPRSARLSWMRASREGFELRGFGWAAWDNSPGFGILASDSRDGRLDSATLTALGMSA